MRQNEGGSPRGEEERRKRRRLPLLLLSLESGGSIPGGREENERRKRRKQKGAIAIIALPHCEEEKILRAKKGERNKRFVFSLLYLFFGHCFCGVE